VIIRQGDTEGDKFYIIEKGEVVCEKSSSDTSGPPVESMRLGPGSYFGELALLTNQPRQVLCLHLFHRLTLILYHVVCVCVRSGLVDARCPSIITNEQKVLTFVLFMNVFRQQSER
jgi:hypothetical protein